MKGKVNTSKHNKEALTRYYVHNKEALTRYYVFKQRWCKLKPHEKLHCQFSLYFENVVTLDGKYLEKFKRIYIKVCINNYEFMYLFFYNGTRGRPKQCNIILIQLHNSLCQQIIYKDL